MGYASWRGFGPFLAERREMITRIKNKPRALTLGDFIAGCNCAWGRQRAKGFIRLAAKARLILSGADPS
jgi:hypothetical protein